MHGLHLTADLHDCPVALRAMTEPDALRAVCLGAVHAAGLQPVGELFHRFAPAPDAAAGLPVGITGVVLLAESHLAVHTWPEIAAVTLDVYVCNFGADNSARAYALLDSLIRAFEPEHIERHALTRGARPTRAQRRAAPKRARIPRATKGPPVAPGDRPTYSSDEGLS